MDPTLEEERLCGSFLRITSLVPPSTASKKATNGAGAPPSLKLCGVEYTGGQGTPVGFGRLQECIAAAADRAIELAKRFL
jgi:hypothetical protein